MGLLAGGVLANSLLLVYLAIGAAALAAIMLTVGVLIWREEVFGASSAAQAIPAAKQTAGPSPVLSATGVAQPGRPAGGAVGNVATIGATAQDDFVVEPPPRAAATPGLGGPPGTAAIPRLASSPATAGAARLGRAPRPAGAVGVPGTAESGRACRAAGLGGPGTREQVAVGRLARTASRARPRPRAGR